jgi:hypothetical protein
MLQIKVTDVPTSLVARLHSKSSGRYSSKLYDIEFGAHMGASSLYHMHVMRE